MNKKVFIILIVVALAAIIITAVYFSFQEKEVKTTKILEQKPTACLLDENLEVAYRIEDKETPLADVVINIRNKKTKENIFSFEIDNIRKNYYPIELHKCGIYVIRMFNYDPAKIRHEVGYKTELWRYYYNGSGEPILLFHEKVEQEGRKIYKSYYGTDFRIDPYEKYIVLDKWFIEESDDGYFKSEDNYLVVKNLKIKEDILALAAKEIAKQHPNIVGNFNMREWTKDGRYFWGDIFVGAYVNGYFRIDATNWKADTFEAPEGAMGGFPLNINTGYVPVQPGQIWTGDYQLTQELKEQYRKEGKKSQLYLYNLFTKEKILIETVDEPLFSFKSKWLSDTELEYELPSGEKKVYKIKE